MAAAPKSSPPGVERISPKPGGRPRKTPFAEAESFLNSASPADLSELRVQLEYRYEPHQSPYCWDSQAGRGYIRLTDGLVVPADELYRALRARKVPLPARLEPETKIAAVAVRALLPEMLEPDVAKIVTQFAFEVAVSLRAVRQAEQRPKSANDQSPPAPMPPPQPAAGTEATSGSVVGMCWRAIRSFIGVVVTRCAAIVRQR